MSLFRTKSIDALIAASEEPDKRLRKTLGSVEPDRARHRRRHRLRHLHCSPARRPRAKRSTIKSILNAPVLDLILHGAHAGSHDGPARRRSGHLALVSCWWRIACCFAGALLRRTGVDDPHRRQRVHVRLRDPGRDLRLDHRLGPHPRVRRLQHVGGGRILGVLQDLLDNLFGFHLPAQLRYPTDSRRPVQPAGCFNVPALLITLLRHLDPGARRARRAPAPTTSWSPIKIAAILIFCLGRRARHQHRELASVRAERLLRRADRRRPSSSSPTSASIRSRPRPRNAAVRSATCRSASSRP